MLSNNSKSIEERWIVLFKRRKNELHMYIMLKIISKMKIIKTDTKMILLKDFFILFHQR